MWTLLQATADHKAYKTKVMDSITSKKDRDIHVYGALNTLIKGQKEVRLRLNDMMEKIGGDFVCTTHMFEQFKLPWIQKAMDRNMLMKSILSRNVHTVMRDIEVELLNIYMFVI